MFQLTSFLEKMDQSAGEIVAHATNQATPGRKPSPEAAEGDEQHEVDEHAEGAIEEDPSVAGNRTATQHATAAATAAPTGATDPYAENLILQKKIDTLLKTNAESERKFDRILKDRDARHAALQKDYDTCMARLREAQAAQTDATQRLTESRTQIHALEHREAGLKERYAELHTRFESCRDSLLRAETQLSDSSEQVKALSREREVSAVELQQLHQQLDRSKAEIQENRAKAQLLIQEKDRTIDSLQRQLSEGNASMGTGAAPGKFLQIQQELEATKETLQWLRHQMQQTSASDRQTIEQLQSQVEELKGQLSTSEKLLNSSKAQEEDAQHGVRASMELYNGEVAAHQATRSHYESLIAQKDEELVKMRRRVGGAGGADLVIKSGQVQELNNAGGEYPNPQPSQHDVQDLERRCKDLAELVMEKQAALEAKRSEAEQWRTRSELLQQRLREAELLANTIGSGRSSCSPTMGSGGFGSGGSRAVTIEEDREVQDSLNGDFSRSRFFGTLQRRGAWGQRVAGVAQTLDSVSLKTGTLLRRSSVLRVGVIAYVILLHLWVFIVLSFTSGGCESTPASVQVK
jgi:hypothetical protein